MDIEGMLNRIKATSQKPTSFSDSFVAIADATKTKGQTQRIFNQQGNEPNFIKDRLLNNIVPYSYSDIPKRLWEVIKNSDENKKAVLSEMETEPKRDDAWRMYLGYPQKHNTFTESKYKPSDSNNPNAKYYRHDVNPIDLIMSLREAIPPESKQAGWSNISDFTTMAGKERQVMNNFKLGVGNDDKGNYISIYDKWDFPFNDYIPDGILGKPFEIYDRIYEDSLYTMADSVLSKTFGEKMAEKMKYDINTIFYNSSKAKPNDLTNRIRSHAMIRKQMMNEN